MVRVVHAGDFHLDSAFGALTPEQARQRRMESRRTPERLVEWANDHGADLLLLSGDLFDSDSPYGDTAPDAGPGPGPLSGRTVVIAPGNHDPLTPDGPYARTRWSDNVHIFTEDRMQTITFPDLNCVPYTARPSPPRTLRKVPPQLPCAAGRPYPHWSAAPWRRSTSRDSRYRPIRAADIAGSGLDYLALGHVHSCSGVLTAGAHLMGLCGCIGGPRLRRAGRTGISLRRGGGGTADLHLSPLPGRRYCIAQVDVTRWLDALRRAPCPHPETDIYRIRLTGETAEPPRLTPLDEALSPDCFYPGAAGPHRCAPGSMGAVRRGHAAGVVPQELRRQYDAAPDDAVRRRIRAGGPGSLKAFGGHWTTGRYEHEEHPHDRHRRDYRLGDDAPA